ncbi:MAG: hypothetical protein KDA84_04550 [Planctomycetaceae bacterium]|nr:hypothetical protein [Planctomycetaceae bacterium]
MDSAPASDAFADQPTAPTAAPAAPPATFGGQTAAASSGAGDLGTGTVGDFFSFGNFRYRTNVASNSATSFQERGNPFTTRSFKILDNQNPMPVDRVYFSFSFFNDVDQLDTQVYRYILGGEKTFMDGQASFLVHVPMITINPGGTGTGVLATSGPESGVVGSTNSYETDIGDVTLGFKYILMGGGPCDDYVLTGGLTGTIPVGPDTLGGKIPLIETDVDHNGSVQPFLTFGTRTTRGAYVQAYTGLDVPIDDDDATYWFNTVSAGYLIPMGDRSSFISAIVPKLEVHANSPINNRNLTVYSSRNSRNLGASNSTGIFPIGSSPAGAGTRVGQAELPNAINLTYGVTTVIGNSASLTLAGSSPLSAPQMFDYELQLQLNIFFGNASKPRFVGQR